MNIQEFKNSEFGTLSTITTENNEILFVGKEVADILEYSNTYYALDFLDAEEKQKLVIPTFGKNKKMVLITESGLYHLIIKSTKPKAKQFRKWVTSELLPQIRKTGTYLPDNTADLIKIVNEKIQSKCKVLVERRKVLQTELTVINRELSLIDTHYKIPLKHKNINIETLILQHYPKPTIFDNIMLMNATELIQAMQNNSNFPKQLTKYLKSESIGKILRKNNYDRISTNYTDGMQKYRYKFAGLFELIP